MTIVEAIRNIVKQCPYLDEYCKGIGVDYLGSDTTYYSIESVPSQTVLKKILSEIPNGNIYLILPVGSYTAKKCGRTLKTSGSLSTFQTETEQFSEAGVPGIGER